MYFSPHEFGEVGDIPVTGKRREENTEAAKGAYAGQAISIRSSISLYILKRKKSLKLVSCNLTMQN